MENLDLSHVKEELPKLHSSYVGASEKEAELEFLKVNMGGFMCRSHAFSTVSHLSEWVVRIPVVN